jgi:hypothetical protein
MRWLGIFFGLGFLACSSAASLSHTKEEPRSTTSSVPTPLTKPTSTPSNTGSNTPKEPAGDALLPGSVVRITEIAAEDPLAKDAASLLGLLCSSEGHLFVDEEGNAQGEALCGSQKTVTSFTHTKVAMVYGSPKNLPDPNPDAKFSGKSVAVGKIFKIHSIDPSDAYFKHSKKLVGLSCVVTRELKNNGENWFSGTAKCGTPVEFMYFSKVSVEVK